MIKYFISWATSNYGFGNCIIEHHKEIQSYDDLLIIEEQIRQSAKIAELPIIINYKRMYDE